MHTLTSAQFLDEILDEEELEMLLIAARKKVLMPTSNRKGEWEDDSGHL